MWKESSSRVNEFFRLGDHTDRHTNRNKLCAAVARRPLRGIMLVDSATGWHIETPKHLAHIMRQGRSFGASPGRVGGAIGICQSRAYSTQTLDPSVTKCFWRMAAADRADIHSSAGSYLAGRMNLSQGRDRQHSPTVYIRWKGNFN